MRRIAVLLSILCLFSIWIPVAAQEPLVQDQPFPLVRYRLPNGLRVWVQPRADSESVATLLVVGVGARYETQANNGISHFVEHMAFVGTERWTEDEITRVITRRGGRWNAGTGLESTVYWAHVAAQDLEIALDWLDQIVFQPTFPAEKVDKERAVIFQERWGRYGWLINTIDALGFGYDLGREIRRAIFPDSSLGMGVAGEDASLDGLDRAALMEYYGEYYTPENATLIVTGNVGAEEVLELAEAYMGDETGGERPPKPETPALPDDGPQRLVVRGPLPTDRTSLVMGARTVGRDDPDRWALMVLAELLDTELTEEIRNRRGLVYGLSAYNLTYSDAGYLAISTTSQRAQTETIAQIIEEHLDGIRRGEVDGEAVEDAKAALQGRWALRMEDNLARANWLADWSLVVRDGRAVPDYQAAIGAVEADDLVRVVNGYLTPQRSFSGLHAPVVTVASGAAWLVGIVASGVGVWVVRRVRRRRRGRAADESG